MRLCGFDLETRGVQTGFALQPFRIGTGEAWITSAAIATDTKVVGRLNPAKEWLRQCLQAAAKTDTTIVGHNIAFDISWLIALGLRDEVFACGFLDTLLLWKHATASPDWTGHAPASYGLKAAVKKFYPDEGGYEDGVDFNADTPEELQKLLTYNKLDAELTLKLARLFISKLTERQLNNALIEACCIPLVADAHGMGIVADRDAAEALAQKLDEKAKLAMVTLAFHPKSNGPVPEDVVRSPTKLRKLLYQDWCLPVVKLTDKGASSTDRDVLSQLAPLDERAALLNEYRESIGNRTKFAVGTMNSLDYNGDGRVRPVFRVFGTYSGRMTVSSKVLKGKDERPTGIPLHQMKRGQEFRNLIVAPEGHTLLELDFSGQEYRWLAVMSRDTTMLGLCAPGEDGHSYMAAKVGQWNYKTLRTVVHQPEHADYKEAKRLRQLGKVANLSLQYRTSANTLQRVARTNFGIHLTPQEAKAIHATYRVTYPGVPVYWAQQIRKAKLNGWVETIAGRRVWVGFENDWTRLAVIEGKEGYVDNKWQAESTSLNFPIQGSGADQKYLGLKVVKDYLPQVEGKFYFELHDSIAVVVPDRYAEKTGHDLKHLLSNMDYKSAWGVDLPILFPVDGKAGKSWGTMKEITNE